MEIHPKDEKYFEQFPEDPDFDPEHNKRVIDQTIKETNKIRKKKEKEHDEAYKERAHAVSRYLKSLEQKGGSKDVEKYFGRRYLARLRGKEVLERIKDGLTVYGKNQSIVRKPGETIERR